jgi:hypothetical protein
MMMNNSKVMLVNCDESSGAGQYAHTYESLDTLDMPVARNQHRTGTLVHLGVNGRNYRTVMNHELLLSNHNNQQQMTVVANNISPPSSDINDSTGTTHFNLSSSSSSSSSGASSTHQLLKPAGTNAMTLPHQQHHLITVNDLNQLNQFLSGSGWSPDSAAYYSSIQQQQQQQANSNSGGQTFSLVHPSFVMNSGENFKSHLV